MGEKTKKYCPDCGLKNHFFIWTDELFNHLYPFKSDNFLTKRLGKYFDVFLEKFFLALGLISLEKNLPSKDIPPRSTYFINEAKKFGFKFKLVKSVFGYTNHFQMEKNGKIYRFDSLPLAEFTNKSKINFVDDKWLVKKYLQKFNFPVAPGKSFWFFQKKKAVSYGNKLGFPLVVKPRCGSFSRHTTTNIKNTEELKYAINKVLKYSPDFIIEKFISNAYVFRATVIDFDFVACVKQIPANVVGDGISSIRQLIDNKNNHPLRGKPDQKESILYKIVENKTTESLLKERGYNFSTIPEIGETVYLQRDPFLKLGGDLIEVTEDTHHDNVKLFKKIAKLFDIKVVGIDFLAQDISISFKNQNCAILELNSCPCIEIHHVVSSGKPQNVAGALVNMVLKYYK